MEFDKYAANYNKTISQSVAGVGGSPDYFAHLKADNLVWLAEKFLGSPGQISCLDVGCGTGLIERFLAGRVAQLCGCDASPLMLKEARVAVPALSLSVNVPNEPLPYPDGSFDLTFSSCTMHHVPPPDLPFFVREMLRVTRPGGLVATLEHNPFNPVTRAAVAACELDHDAILLTPSDSRRLFSAAGLSVVALWFYIFVPPRLSVLRPLERLFRHLPIGAQYMLCGPAFRLMADLLSLVIPLYNEEANVTGVATAILKEFRGASLPLELVLVDNGSHDATGAAIDSLAREFSEVLKIRVEQNQGYGWGVLSGLAGAHGTHVGFMGGDGQIGPEDVVRVWRKMLEGNLDLCKTRRVRRQDGFSRVVITVFCNVLFPIFFPVRTTDINGTPKIMRQETYRSLALSSKDWFLDAEVMIKCARRKLKIGEVPVTFHPRAGGASHVRLSSITEFLVNMLRAWREGLR